MAAMLGLRHPATDWLENLGSSQFRDQKTEGIPPGSSVHTHVTARPRAALNDARQLQLPQSANHGGTRNSEPLHELRFTREPLARLILAGRYGIEETLASALVFRGSRLRTHGLIIQVVPSLRKTLSSLQRYPP